MFALRSPFSARRSLLAGLVAAIALFASPVRGQTPALVLQFNDPVPADQYMTVTEKLDTEGHASYTLEAWVYPTSYAGFPTIFGNDYRVSYWLGLNSFGQVRFYPRGGSYFDSPGAVPLNRWSHIAVTYSSTAGSKVYVDGALRGTNTTILGVPGTSPGDLRLGGDREGGAPAYLWRGSLQDLRIWSSVRTAAEIGHYRFVRPHPFTSPTLQALWAWPGFGTVPYLHDFAGAHENGALYVNHDPAAIVVDRGTPLDPNVAADLDGSTNYVHLFLPGSENGTTISAWIAPASLGNYMTIVGANYLENFWFGVTPGGGLRFYPRGLALAPPVTTPDNLVAANRWQHVAVRYDGSETCMFVNGARVYTSTAVTGPMAGPNTPTAGADDVNGTMAYFFHGQLGQIRMFHGAESDAQIRERMFLGHGYSSHTVSLTNRDGEPGSCRVVYYEPGAPFVWLRGTNPRLVRSGAPVVLRSMNTEGLAQALVKVVGGTTALPQDSSATLVSSLFPVSYDREISHTRVWVMAPIENLGTASVTLRSPAGTIVSLVDGGSAVGRNLQTAFDDDGPTLLSEPRAPFLGTLVRPSTPLAALNGERTAGSWRLTVSSSASSDKVGLWAWALHFNESTVGAEPVTPASEVALSNTGPNPSHGRGALTFELPREAAARLELLDVSGRRVALLHDARTPAGSTRVQWEGARLEPGVYFARLLVDGRTARSIRLVLAR